MKIDSVATMDVKTREEELEELLAPDGTLNNDIFIALQGVIEVEKTHPADDDTSTAAYAAFDNAVNRYVKYAIEYDRLKR
jgi:hypothetical protein